MQKNFTNRFFIQVDVNDYVVSMMIAINQEEADTYVEKNSIELSQEDFESIGQDSKYTEGKIIKGEPRIPALNEETARAIKSSLFREATTRIQLLQDAVEMEMQATGDNVKLTDWKKYRILLDRVNPSTAPNIKWPEMPATD